MLFEIYAPISGVHVELNQSGESVVDPLEYVFSREIEAEDLSVLGGYLNDVCQDEAEQLWFRTPFGWVLARWSV